MDKSRLAALTVTVAVAAATGVPSISHVYANDARLLLAQAAPGQDAARIERGPRGPGGDRPQLFTPEERQQFEQKMRAAKTPEERDAARKEMRAAMEQRAKEKGVELPKQGPRGDGGQRGGEIARLFTPEERALIEQKMRSAKTPEERDAARKEMRAAVEQRAKEKGVTLPERGNMEHRPTRPRPDGDAKPRPQG